MKCAVFDKLYKKADDFKVPDPAVCAKAYEWISELRKAWMEGSSEDKAMYVELATRYLQMPKQKFYEEMRDMHGRSKRKTFQY